DASHELRTPLTSILANLELLEADLQGEDKEIAASALRSSRRMRRLVADLLLLARADAGRATVHQSVDLAQVVREAVAEAISCSGSRTPARASLRSSATGSSTASCAPSARAAAADLAYRSCAPWPRLTAARSRLVRARPAARGLRCGCRRASRRSLLQVES